MPPCVCADLSKNPVEGFSAGLVDDSNVFEWEVCAVRPMAPAELQVNASAPAAIRASALPYHHPATAPLRLSDALPP